MTAELSDAFRTKREGVAFVLDAAEDALGDRPLSVLTTAGELVSVEAARARPWDVAAANWVATALAVAGAHPDALLIDVGSTTADIVPIAAGRVAATGRNDLERLLAGELVYTGVLRTNLAAIAPRVPVRGGWCPVSSEYFAISADVHLVLGHLAAEAYDCPTPDGRPATVAFARERIARLVCADVEQLDAGEIDAIAAFLYGEQLRQIEDAARRVQRPLPPEAPVVAVGSGAFLGREVAARLGRAVADRPRRGAHGGEGHPPRRWPRCWRHAGADRRQGRRRLGGRRRRAAGAVPDARRARRSAIRCSSSPAARASPTPCATPTAASGCARTTAHRMAILGMEQFGWLLSDLIPGAERCADLARAARRHGRRVLLPAGAAARRAARVVGGDLRLDRRVGRRSGRRRAARAGQGGRRPVRGVAAREASRSRA